MPLNGPPHNGITVSRKIAYEVQAHPEKDRNDGRAELVSATINR